MRPFVAILLLTMLTHTVSARAQDVARDSAAHTALLLAGYPLFDADSLLSAADRATLRAGQARLRECCALEVVLILRAAATGSNAEADLAAIQTQLRQGALLSPQSLVLLLHADPPQAVAARAPILASQTAPLTMARLDALATAQTSAARRTALTALFAALENTTLDIRAQAAAQRWQNRLQPSPWLWSLIFHLAMIGVAALITVTLMPWRRPNMARSVYKAGSPALTLPSRSALPPAPLALAGQVSVLWIVQGRGRRHRGLGLMAALLVALVLCVGQLVTVLPVPAGIHPFLSAWVDTWPLQGGLSVLGFVLTLLLWFVTPLGPWLSGPGRRQRALQHDLGVAMAGCQPALLMVVQRHRGKMEMWMSRDFPFKPALLQNPAERLSADLSHGVVHEAVSTFMQKVERLARIYAPAGEAQKGGQAKTL